MSNTRYKYVIFFNKSCFAWYYKIRAWKTFDSLKNARNYIKEIGTETYFEHKDRNSKICILKIEKEIDISAIYNNNTLWLIKIEITKDQMNTLGKNKKDMETFYEWDDVFRLMFDDTFYYFNNKSKEQFECLYKIKT